MKQYVKKFFVMLSCMLICICGISVSAYATDYYTEGYFKYTITGDHIVIESYFGSEDTVVIPDYIAELPVTQITGKTFKGNTTVRSITVPETVTQLDADTFTELHQLRKIIVQSESVSVQAPEACVVVEDYPVYADTGKKPDQSGTGSKDDKKETVTPGQENGSGTNQKTGMSQTQQTSENQRAQSENKQSEDQTNQTKNETNQTTVKVEEDGKVGFEVAEETEDGGEVQADTVNNDTDTMEESTADKEVQADSDDNVKKADNTHGITWVVISIIGVIAVVGIILFFQKRREK